MYSALSQYNQAQVVGESKGIGEQICRLTEAQRLMDQANSYIQISQHFSGEYAEIKKLLTASIKDNDFIVCFSSTFCFNVFHKLH